MASAKGAVRMAHEMAKRKKPLKDKEKAHVESAMVRSSNKSTTPNPGLPDNIVYAIDNKNAILKLADQIKRLEKSKDVNSFFQDIAPDMAAKLAIMVDDPEIPSKTKVEIIRDLMDRAGYGKVTKHVTANVSVKDSKEAIISHIMGAQKDLRAAGIEIVDDDEDEN